MSAPAPRMVNVPPPNDAEPAMPVDPTSWLSQGLGNVGAPPDVVNDSVSDVSVMFANVRETSFQKYVVPAVSGVDGVHEYVSGGSTASCAGTLATSAMLPVLVPR